MKKAFFIYGGWEGHQPKETSEIFIRALSDEGFDVEVSTTLNSLLDLDELKGKDVIIINWTGGNLEGEMEKNLLQAIKGGTGFAGWHGGAGDAFRNNSEYQFMVGGQFVTHPGGIFEYEVKIVKVEDPIVMGIGDFKLKSEQYYMHVDPSNEVLATTTFQNTEFEWINGTVMPSVWKRKYGKGNVFYASFGHQASDFEIPQAKEIVKRGILWASGAL